MVAKPEGEIEEIPEEENPRAAGVCERRDARGRPGKAGEHRVGEARVDVNPFWSQRAHLQAMRPEDLPEVPASEKSKMVEITKDRWRWGPSCGISSWAWSGSEASSGASSRERSHGGPGRRKDGKW